jgi:hypothetical protein
MNFRVFVHLSSISRSPPSLHWLCLSKATISEWPPSVSPLPLFHTVSRLPPLIQLTLMLPVLPLAEWQLISIPGRFSEMLFLRR